MDIAHEHARLRHELEAAFARVVEASSFVLGAEVEAFELEYASYAKVGECVSVANGTDAIELGLRAIGVGPGDEVIVPAYTFVATALAPMRCGATPRLVDVEPDSLLLDPELIGTALTKRTRAVIPVHLFGQLAACEAIKEASGPVIIVEDAAQAHGATRHGTPVGRFGALAATSFYPGKNLGALGDGGAVLTNDRRLASQVRLLRNYGSDRKYSHPTIGFNSRLDELQAAFLRVKLRYLAHGNQKRREAAAYYTKNLLDQDALLLPTVSAGNEHVWHLYVVRLRQGGRTSRDQLLQSLHGAGVEASVHYPSPLHLHGGLAELGYTAGQFPVSESASRSVLSLPIYPDISRGQQDYVMDCLTRYL